MFIATTLLLVRVTALLPLCAPTGVVANVRFEGARPAVGTDPMPERETVTLPFWASLLTVNAPLREPLAVGVKTTVTLQLALGTTVAPQLFDCEKSPETEMELISSVIFPLFVMVTEPGALLVPTLVVAKERLVDDRVAVDAPPGPVRRASFSVPLTFPVSEMTATSP